MGQMFPPGPAAAASGFYVPTMPRAYYPNNMQQIRPQPRWPNQQQVRGPAQPGGGEHFYALSYHLSNLCPMELRANLLHRNRIISIG